MSISSTKSKSGDRPNPLQDHNLRIMLAITFVAIIPIFSINPTLAIIAQALTVSSQQIGLVVTAFLVTVAINTRFIGCLADRAERKKGNPRRVPRQRKGNSFFSSRRYYYSFYWLFSRSHRQKKNSLALFNLICDRWYLMRYCSRFSQPNRVAMFARIRSS